MARAPGEERPVVPGMAQKALPLTVFERAEHLLNPLTSTCIEPSGGTSAWRLDVRSMRDKKLIIVESPAKAKTIAGFLGDDYRVEASFGHVRDLPTKAAEIPADVKKESWSRLGVNVDADFEPLYIVPSDKKKQVSKLRTAMKEAKTVSLATDEDREGESISWHLLKVLKPPKTVDVKRIVFHEVTPEAIEYAIHHPRDVNDSLVKAQESRRILDRLYGYTLSPLLWRKVARGLSAGRVQSVATRLIVERERLRKAFVPATWWDLSAEIEGEPGASFKAQLIRVDDTRLANGRSFDPDTGQLKDTKSRLLLESDAKALREKALAHRPWTVSKLVQTPGTERPVPPFTTSTLQQEANRKLRMTARRTMQVAQSLYEGVDLGGERVGLITYMRTDSVTLSERALTETRAAIRDFYGDDYLPEKAVRYRTKSRNAQEAHEAIRPTDMKRRPQDLKSHLDPDQMRLYEMIWKRTMACQMVPARTLRTQLEIRVDNLTFAASGKQILFPGFLRAYVEGSDDPHAQLGDKETVLPPLQMGQEVIPTSVEALSHTTRPPARYTEASLVKKLEEEGIGRPSTYATIISTIQDRGYIFKRGNELVPTFTAHCVIEFLEKHFDDLVDVGFTSAMETHLDEIAGGKRDAVSYLRDFYSGSDDDRGLVKRVSEEENRLEFPTLDVGEDPDTGERIVVRVGRFGPYIQRGEGGKGNLATLPDDLAPSELSVQRALELLKERSGEAAVVAEDRERGLTVRLQRGRYGPYLEVTSANADEDEKPKRVSIPTGLSPDDLTPEIVWQLVSLPRSLGTHPETKEEISTAIGRFGPYVRCGKEYRSLPHWQSACTITLDEALKILAEPKKTRGRTRSQPKVLKTFGELEGVEGEVRILDGRYGPYVTDGSVNATIPKGRSPEDISADEAVSLILEKAAAGGRKKKSRTKKAQPKKTTAKKASASGSGRKTGTRKTTKKTSKAQTEAESAEDSATKSAGTEPGETEAKPKRVSKGATKKRKGSRTRLKQMTKASFPASERTGEEGSIIS